MSPGQKAALREASLDELAMELRERGWRIVPVEVAGLMLSGFGTGYWPPFEKGKDGA